MELNESLRRESESAHSRSKVSSILFRASFQETAGRPARAVRARLSISAIHSALPSDFVELSASNVLSNSVTNRARSGSSSSIACLNSSVAEVAMSQFNHPPSSRATVTSEETIVKEPPFALIIPPSRLHRRRGKSCRGQEAAKRARRPFQHITAVMESTTRCGKTSSSLTERSWSLGSGRYLSDSSLDGFGTTSWMCFFPLRVLSHRTAIS